MGVGAGRELGRYRLINELAKSQLGGLWAGLGGDSSEGEEAQPVMVRRFDTSVIASPDQIDTLSEAAWWAMELSGEQIARTVDVVKTGNELGMVYPYKEGEVLRALLRLATFKRKPFRVPVALRVLLDVLEAAGTARARAAEDHIEIASGGLSPDSVFVGTDGTTLLLDAGAAGVLCGAERVLGNPEMAAYAAPEQLVDQPIRADARADVFTAGVLLSEMLLGKRLFVGSSYAAVSTKVKAAKVARLDEVKPSGGESIPAEVADLVARALSADPGERFADCRELILAIESLSIEPAAREAVGDTVEALDGNALGTRRKVMDRARGMASAAKPIAGKPEPIAGKPEPIAGKPEPIAGKPEPAERPPKPARARRPPPPRRAPMESLDSELLQPDSEAPESLEVPIDVELDAPKIPFDIPVPPGFEETRIEADGTAGAATEPASKSAEPDEGDALATDATPPPSATDGDSGDSGDSGEPGSTGAQSATEEDKPAQQDEPAQEPAAEPGVAAAGSSPGAGSAPDAGAIDATTLDAPAEDAVPSSLAEVEARTQRARRIVAFAIGGLAVLLLAGLGISALHGHGKAQPTRSASAPAAPPPRATAAPATASEPPPTPSATASAPGESGGADAGAEQEARDAAPGTAAKDSGPRAVASATTTKPAAPRPRPRPAIHRHYGPRPRPRHKFTPSGI